MVLIQSCTPAWEYEEKGYNGTRGWFPMHNWIAIQLETHFINGRGQEETIIRFPDTQGVVWKFDLMMMTQRRIRDGQDECTRRIRRILQLSTL